MGTVKRHAASIIIPNYNGNHHLTALFDHLAAQTLRDFEVVFVDNGSGDGSLSNAEQLARRHGLPLRAVRNETNRGFAPACNQGIAAANARWLVLLNNDTRPEPVWLEMLVNTASGAPGVGMVASKMLRAAHPEQIDSAGIAVDWMGIVWDWRGGQLDQPDEREVVEVFGPCGGAALYSREMLDAVGAFDEDFFAYMEDVDLAWRARLAGWRCLLQPQARVLHDHSATLGHTSPRKRFLLGRNKVWLLVKNYPNPWFARHLPLLLAYEGMAATYGAVAQRDGVAWQGRLAGLRQLPRFWRKRREIQRHWRNVENWQQGMSPAVAPWRVNERFAHLT
ncbi:MAG: glycosyltransferase family 2 protein [Caldilineaceae bacterium]|nr:glycosyltransferase family 2 protein [Caldilineaceae bacterium]